MIQRVVALFCFVFCAGTAHASVPAHVENASKPTPCAESDNVYVKFSGVGISHLTIAARPPAYLASVGRDEKEPNFAACDQTRDPSFPSEPLDVVLFQDDQYRLVGHRYPTFWRPERVDFRVGDTVTNGLHLIQLLRKTDGEWIEILVLYPPDGYWRVKPLPPRGKPETLYGSSFLVGPIEMDGRPYVPLKSVAFNRADLSFHLTFRTGEGVLRVIASSPEQTLLSVDLPRATGSAPWAALRSMFTSTEMADVAEATLTDASGKQTKGSILGFGDGDAVSAVFGRSVPSHHNTSAPDLVFGDFAR